MLVCVLLSPKPRTKLAGFLADKTALEEDLSGAQADKYISSSMIKHPPLVLICLVLM